MIQEHLFISLSLLFVLVGPLSGWLLGGKTTDFQGFVSRSRTYGVVPITLSTIGTIVGGGMFLAVGKMGYEAGVLGAVFGIAYLIGLFIFANSVPLINRALDEFGVETLSDAILASYGRTALLVFGFVGLLVFVPLCAAQITAMVTIVSYYSGVLSSPWVVYIPAGLALLMMFAYPALGGLKVDIVSDIVQALLLVGSVLVLSLGAALTIDPGKILLDASPQQLNGLGYGWVTLFGVIIFLTPTFFVRSDMWQRVRAAKSDKAAQWAFSISGVASLLFYSLFSLLGLWAFVEKYPSADYATLEVLGAVVTSPILATFVVATVFVAILSSADTFVNNAAIHLHSILFWRKGKERTLRSIIITSFVIIAASGVLAVVVADIVDLFVASLSILLMFLPSIIGLFYRDVRSTIGAEWSMLGGLVVFGVLFVAWDPKSAFVPAVFASFLLYFVGRAIERRRAIGVDS